MKLVTYNLRYASEDDPQPWSRRRGPMIELLREIAPDVLGTQEGLAHQLDDLREGLGEHYAMVAEPRHDGASEEHSAILYDTRSLELVGTAHRWLSETPEEPGSSTWGNHFPRMFTRAELRRRSDGVAVTVIATHLDNAVAYAQVRAARQLREEIETIDAEQPVVLMGDFNAGEHTEPHRVLTEAGLRDAWLVAAEQGPRLGTFNNYEAPDPEGDRIDWILVSRHVQVVSARMVDVAPGGQYPSDHLPVEAVVEI